MVTLPADNPIAAEILGNLNTASKLLVRSLRNRNRPSVVLRPSLSQFVANGDVHYLAEYGAAFGLGETPEAACQDFDECWTRGE